MRRLRLLFLAFALLVIAPAGVLVHYAHRFIGAEERRLRAEAEEERARAIAAVEAEVRAAVARVEAVEARRPWYHYRNRFVPPDLASNVIALVRTPLYPAPADPLIRTYFEQRADGRIVSPAEGPDSEADDEAAALARAQCAIVAALEPALAPALGRLSWTGLGTPELTTKVQLDNTLENERALGELELAQKGDLSRQKKLAEDWQKHQEAQASVKRVYSAERSKAPNPQVAQNAVQEAVPLAAAVTTHDFRYAWVDTGEGALALVAARLVDLDGRRAIQGYELDVERLREIARTGLERLGLADEVRIAAGPPERVFTLVGNAPASARVARVLGPSRLLLYGSGGLILFLATAGLGVLYGIVRGHVELARRRTDFVAAVSHELKAPLTAIRALAEMLSLGIAPSRAKEQEYFGIIRAESERLSRLIANVLDLARIERRERRYEIAPGDLGAVVRAVTDTWRPNLAARGFELEVAVADGLPPVAFDRDAIEQVVANLLDNAAKYTEPCATKRIAVRVRPAAAGGGAAIEVEDTGIGISSEDRLHLFRRFARGTSPLARGTGGAGLGLAIAKEHLDAHRGKLQVDSAPGKGSLFRVELPGAPPAG